MFSIKIKIEVIKQGEGKIIAPGAKVMFAYDFIAEGTRQLASFRNLRDKSVPR